MIKLIHSSSTDDSHSEEKTETIILIHGFLCTSSIWKPLINQLKNNYIIFTVDLPGHNGNGSEIVSLTELALEITKELALKKLTNVHLIGHSLGGYLAGEITKLKQIDVKSISLINSTLLADSKQKKKDRELAIRAIKITPTIFAKNVIEKLFLETNRTKLVLEIEEIQKHAKLITPTTIISYLTAMKNRSATLEFIKETPTHYLSSINDTTILYDSITKQTKLNNAQLTTLKRSGHMSFLEETNLVSESIHSFFVPFTS